MSIVHVNQEMEEKLMLCASWSNLINYMLKFRTDIATNQFTRCQFSTSVVSLEKSAGNGPWSMTYSGEEKSVLTRLLDNHDPWKRGATVTEFSWNPSMYAKSAEDSSILFF